MTEGMISSNSIPPGMQPIIIQMAPQAPTSLIQPATVIQPLRTIVNPPPQNKLPLPKLKSTMHPSTTTTASGLVNVYSTPMISSQPWRLPKEKKKRNRAKKVQKESNSVVEGITTTNDKEQSEFVRISTISESVPKEILASQEHETEVVDLTNAPSASSSESNPDQKVSETKTNKKAKNKETNQVTSSKIAKTKSSYSIAALCQMSVNIGADPAAGVPDPNAASGVSSPGVISLNSTESPRATPTPQSPKPPPQPQPTPKLQQNKPIGKAGERSKKVIEELKPVGDKVAEMQQGPTSPTKSYLTQFPVVKDQQQQQQHQQQQKKPDQQIKQKSGEKLSSSTGKLKEVSATTTMHHTGSTPKVAPLNQQIIPPLTQTMPTVPPPRQTSVDYGPPRPPAAPHSMPSSTPYQTSSASVSSYPDFSRQAAYAKTSNHQMQHYASSSSKHKEYRSAMPNMTMPSSSSTNNPIQFSMQDQQMHHHSGYAQVPMSSHGAHADQSDSTFFSVNQLVNHKGQFQMGNPHPFSTKKSNKRSSTSSASTPQATVARYQKQARQVEVKADTNLKKEETRKAAKNSSRQASSGSSSGRGTNSGNSRSSSSSQASKRSYTAESLLSTHAVGGGQSNEYHSQPQPASNPMHHHSRTASNYPRVSASSEKASSISSNRMPELNWNVGSSSADTTTSAAAATQHFAPFPSISPSPNLFSQDFGGFDFPMFGTTDHHMSAHHQKPRKDQTSARSYAEVNSQQITSNQANQAPPQQVHQQDFHHVQDSSGQQLFDANFFSAAGTLTPSPSVTGVYPGHDDSYINFNPAATTSASTVSSSRQYKSRQQNQVQHQQTNNQMDHHQQTHVHPQHLQGGYSSQQQQLLSGVGGVSSSYSNFNLSTIFPEINVPGLPPTDKIAALLPTVPPPPPAPALPSSSSSRSTSTSLALSTGTSIPSTPEILAPHSISIFGAAGHHAPHQMSFGSMPPFSAASFHHHTSSSSSSSTQPIPAPAPPPPSANSSINFGIHEQ